MQTTYTTVTSEVNENFTVVYHNNIPLAVISYNETDIGNYIKNLDNIDNDVVS
jgi:hypothetical protein